MGEITNRQLNITAAGQIALNLDKQDGNEADGIITKSVWDAFWAKNDEEAKYKGRHEGEVGEEGISVRDAMKLIMTRIFNAANVLKSNVNKIGTDWLNGIENAEVLDANKVDALKEETEAPKTQKTETVEENTGNKKTKTGTPQNNTVTINDCRTTKCAGVYYCEKTKKHYRQNSNGSMEEIKPITKHGRITQFNEDGSHIERFNEKGNNYIVVKYDNTGERIIQTKYVNGKPVRTYKFQGLGEHTSSEVRLHKTGETGRWGLTEKSFNNGDFVQWYDTNKYHGYVRYDKDGNFLYICDKDGNEVK